MKNPRLETFAFTGWRRGDEASVAVTRPVKRTLPALALPSSPDTGPKGIWGPLEILWDGTPEEFERAGERLKGAVLLTREGVPASYPRSVHRAEKVGRAVEAGVNAFLFAAPEPGCLPPTGCARFGRESEIPAAGLSRESAEFLRRLARRGPVRLALRAHGENTRVRSQNVVAELPGRSRSGELIVVGGHLDSHDIAPGARDNASGVCAVLEAARALKAVGFRPTHTIRFVAFGAEEFGLLGSRRHVAELGPDAMRVRLMINVDSPPQTGVPGFQFHRAEEARPFFLEMGKSLGRPVPVLQGLHNHSDHFPFFLAGAPVANLAAEGSGIKGGRGWGHTAADTLDKVDDGALRSVTATLAVALVRLAGPRGLRLPWRAPETVKQILEDEGFQDRLRYENGRPEEVGSDG
ncbi:MAG: M20/M25/M40 family metallo-hydrolase [Planctomycetota bacterium]